MIILGPKAPSGTTSTAFTATTSILSKLTSFRCFVILSVIWFLYLWWLSTSSDDFIMSTKKTSLFLRQQQQQQSFNMDDPYSSFLQQQMSASSQTPPPTFDPYRLIFLISMGQDAMNSNLVERFVWSARFRGQWLGWIVLLTDAPKSRYQNITLPPTTRIQNPNVNVQDKFVVMNPKRQHINNTFREDMPYKRFKTYVLDYIDYDDRLKDVQLIYYLDIDIIVGNSLQKMFYELEALYGIPSSTTNNGVDIATGVSSSTASVQRQLQSSSSQEQQQQQQHSWLRQIPRIWFFQNKYKHMSVQGGQFVLHRQTSQPCLDYWRELIDSNVKEPKDQPALHKMRMNQQRRRLWYDDDNNDGIMTNSTSSVQNTRIHQNDPHQQPRYYHSLHNPQRCQIRTMEWEKYLHFPSNASIFKRLSQNIYKGKSFLIPTLIHIKNSCNSTSQINDDAEGTYIQYIVQNHELAQKIHVQPDGKGYEWYNTSS